MKNLTMIFVALIALSSFSLALADENSSVIQAFTSYKKCVKTNFMQAKQANREFDLNNTCLNQKQALFQLLPAEGRLEIENAIQKMVNVMKKQ